LPIDEQQPVAAAPSQRSRVPGRIEQSPPIPPPRRGVLRPRRRVLRRAALYGRPT